MVSGEDIPNLFIFKRGWGTPARPGSQAQMRMIRIPIRIWLRAGLNENYSHSHYPV